MMMVVMVPIFPYVRNGYDGVMVIQTFKMVFQYVRVGALIAFNNIGTPTRARDYCLLIRTVMVVPQAVTSKTSSSSASE